MCCSLMFIDISIVHIVNGFHAPTNITIGGAAEVSQGYNHGNMDGLGWSCIALCTIGDPWRLMVVV